MQALAFKPFLKLYVFQLIKMKKQKKDNPISIHFSWFNKAVFMSYLIAAFKLISFFLVPGWEFLLHFKIELLILICFPVWYL